MPPSRLRDAQPVHEAGEAGRAPPPGRWSRASSPAGRTPAATSGAARLSGVWPPNWTSAGSGPAAGGLGVDDLQHALRVQRLEVEPDEASKSVETVSGLELTMTACQPSSRSASAAWTAQ